MTQHQYERRQKQVPFYESIIDRRGNSRPALDWSDATPLVPGAIRPGVHDQWNGVERRRFPGSGEE
jgi:hypothetical protein